MSKIFVKTEKLSFLILKTVTQSCPNYFEGNVTYGVSLVVIIDNSNEDNKNEIMEKVKTLYPILNISLAKNFISVSYIFDDLEKYNL